MDSVYGFIYQHILLPGNQFYQMLIGGVNVFDLNITTLNVLLIALIIVLYVSYMMRFLSKGADKSFKEFIGRTVIVLAIISVYFGAGFLKDTFQIIEGGAYTHSYVKNVLEVSDSASTIGIASKGFIVEGKGKSNSRVSSVENISSYMDGKENFYIKPESVNVKFNVISDLESSLSSTISKYDTENFGFVMNGNKIKEFDSQLNIVGNLDYVRSNEKTLKEYNRMFSCIQNTPNSECLNLNLLFSTPGIFSNSPELTGIFNGNNRAYFGKVSLLEDFTQEKVLAPTLNESYYVIDTNDLWYWKVMKVEGSSNAIDKKLTFTLIPNPYTLKLEKTLKYSTTPSGNSELYLRVYKEYKKAKSNACSSGSDCTFYDIYKVKAKENSFDVSEFLSAFSIMNGGFNNSVITGNTMNVKIQGNTNLQTFIGFYDMLSNKGGKTFTLGTNFVGANYKNNSNVIAYTYEDADGNIKRETYSLGVYGSDSFYKKFYNAPTGSGEIGIGGTVLGSILFLFYFVFYVLGNFFIVYVCYQILN